MKRKKCKCGCGREIIWKPYMQYYVPKYIRGHHLRGKTQEEIYGVEGAKKRIEKRKQTLKNNPQILEKAMKKRRQTHLSNPEIMKIAGKKRSQTFKENPNIMKNAREKQKQTLKDNPEIKKNEAKKRLQTLADDPTIMKKLLKTREQTYKDNPDIIKDKERKRQQTLKDNPEIRLNANRKVSANHQGININDWKKFIGREPYDQNWTNKFKRAIRKRDNYICLKCRKHQEKENSSLSVHHIDYDKTLTIKENCCTVCRKCNTEVNANRKHWTKFFQSLLSEKYGYQYENGRIILNFNIL